MTRALRSAIDILTSNPYEIKPEKWRRAARLLRAASPRELHAKLIAGKPITQTKQLGLALGHLQAIEHPNEPRKVLNLKRFPGELIPKLPRNRSAYLRVVMAAGRCFKALTVLKGSSTALGNVKRDTWAACFGDSLLHTLNLERVIRDHDILVLGDTGTGKEAIAHAIQQATPGPVDGSAAPSSALNAAAIPETLVESELFGHVKGAFTGATEPRIGRIRSAEGGCFFLDEVGDLQPNTQVKLLRVIETNEVNPLGTDVGYHVDVRYVAATQANLAAVVEDGGFRRDLYERLAGLIIRMPPLRERTEDIIDIGQAFIAKYLPEDCDVQRDFESWLKKATKLRYPWPGNVRELQNALRSLLLGLEPDMGSCKTALASAAANSDMGANGSHVPIPSRIAKHEATMKEVQDWYLRAVVDHAEENYAQAARILGIDRSTVRRRTRQLDESTR